MKYEVLVNELQWHNVVYRVEAENEEEARDLIISGDGDIISSDFDCVDQRDFNDFKIVEE